MSLVTIKVDCVAALREIKRLKEPDPAQAAVIVELAGADGVGCHLREDRRHIRDRDVYLLKEMVKTRLTLQIAPAEDLIERALEVKPWMVTLMPSSVEDVIVHTGIDLDANRDLFAETAATLKASGINVCYFIEPEIEAVKNAARAKVDAIELNTFRYIGAETIEAAEAELDKIEQMAQLATKLDLMVNCGNGLNYKNIRPLVDLGIIEEFTVGYSVICRATMVGLDRAVREIVDIVHMPPEKS
jgi:pyridoxine 5-phosphate synthase